MSNDDLETVTGTGISVETTPTGKVDFAFDAETKDGIPISGTGTLEVLKKEEAVNASTDTSTLSLNDSAQENLRALVNVNAVNSAIQVLLNLNVNINSIVGEVNQASQAQLN